MKSKGFTLIELLIAIAIMGIFTSIVFGSIATSRSKARDNARIADMKTIELALAIYYDVNRVYPLAILDNYLIDLNVLVIQKYLPSLPTDPQSSQSYKYKLIGSNNTKYCMGVELEGTFPNDTPEVQVLCGGGVYYWASR